MKKKKAEEKEPVFDEDQKEAFRSLWLLIQKIQSYKKAFAEGVKYGEKKEKTNQST